MIVSVGPSFVRFAAKLAKNLPRILLALAGCYWHYHGVALKRPAVLAGADMVDGRFSVLIKETGRAPSASDPRRVRALSRK